MSTATIPTSQILKAPGTRSKYLCPECGASYPGRFALGVHREKKHAIKNDWVKRVIRGHEKSGPGKPSQPIKPGAKVIATADLKWHNGRLKCPECGAHFNKRVTMAVHRSSAHGIRGTSASSEQYHRYAAKKAAKMNGSGAILTSQIPFKHGHYKCPECRKNYKSIQALGMHRHFEHSVTGQYASKHQKVSRKQKRLLLKGATSEHDPADQSTHALSGTEAPQYLPPNGTGRRKTPWSEEALTGFVFAHVHTLIEDACRGREDAVPYITQRLSELLHIEVSGQAARAKRMGLLRSMP